MRQCGVLELERGKSQCSISTTVFPLAVMSKRHTCLDIEQDFVFPPYPASRAFKSFFRGSTLWPTHQTRLKGYYGGLLRGGSRMTTRENRLCSSYAISAATSWPLQSHHRSMVSQDFLQTFSCALDRLRQHNAHFELCSWSTSTVMCRMANLFWRMIRLVIS